MYLDKFDTPHKHLYHNVVSLNSFTWSCRGLTLYWMGRTKWIHPTWCLFEKDTNHLQHSDRQNYRLLVAVQAIERGRMDRLKLRLEMEVRLSCSRTLVNPRSTPSSCRYQMSGVLTLVTWAPGWNHTDCPYVTTPNSTNPRRNGVGNMVDVICG